MFKNRKTKDELLAEYKLDVGKQSSDELHAGIMKDIEEAILSQHEGETTTITKSDFHQARAQTRQNWALIRQNEMIIRQNEQIITLLQDIASK